MRSCLFALLALIVASIGFAPSHQTAVLGGFLTIVGDSNCDGDVTSVDAALVLQADAGLVALLACQELADANGDGVVNSLDAVLILQFVAGLLVTLPPMQGESLQIHHIDVEQGDGALIIAPSGDAAMIDNGRWTSCSNTVDYLEEQGVTSLAFHMASHYHADHIGCLDDLIDAGVTVGTCYDRGGEPESVTATYETYVETCEGKRETLEKNQEILLGPADGEPVTFTVLALDGAGLAVDGENALSVVVVLSYGTFDEVFGGDLTGENPNVESVVGPVVGDVDVYKVNHHGARFSTNDDWLNSTSPEVAIISVGGNSFSHPTVDALQRLHEHDVQTYWTNEGSGVSPDPVWDTVAGDIVIEVQSGGTAYVVRGAKFADAYVSE